MFLTARDVIFSSILVIVSILAWPAYFFGAAHYQRMAPMEQTTAITLDNKLVHRLQDAGVREIRTEPSRLSQDTFWLAVDGQTDKFPVPSKVEAPAMMYRVEMSDNGPVVYVRKEGKQESSPRDYQKIIERDASTYLLLIASQKKKEAQRQSWY